MKPGERKGKDLSGQNNHYCPTVWKMLRLLSTKVDDEWILKYVPGWLMS